MGSGLISEEAHAPNQVAVGDTGRTEYDVVAHNQIVELEDAAKIAETHRNCSLRFFLIAGLEVSHEVPTQALDRRGS